MLSRIRRVECMKRFGEDRVARDVIAPRVVGHAPGIRAGITAETREPVRAGFVPEPAAVVLPYRAVGCLDLRMVEDAFAEDEAAVGRPDEVVERVVGVFGAESRKHDVVDIRPVVTVGIPKERQVRLLRHVDAAVAKLERQWKMQVVGENLRRIGPTVAIGVFEDHEAVAGLHARIDMRIGLRRAHPEPAAGIEAGLDRIGDLGKLLLAGEEVHREPRVDLEGLQFLRRGQPLVGPAALVDRRHRGEVGIVRLVRHRAAMGDVPDPPVAVGAHDVEVAKRRQEVEIAVILVASAGVIEGVQRPVATKELPVEIDGGQPELLVDGRRLAAEALLKQRSREEFVTAGSEVAAVDRERRGRIRDRGQRRREDIGEADLRVTGHLPHRLDVESDPGIVVVGRRHAWQILIGDRRDQHDAGGGPAVERLRLEPSEKRRELSPERRQSILARE